MRYSKRRLVTLFVAILLFQVTSGLPQGYATDAVGYVSTYGKQKKSGSNVRKLGLPLNHNYQVVLNEKINLECTVVKQDSQEGNDENNNLKPRSEEGDDIPTRLKKLVAEESGVPESKITRDSSFREDLGMDSLNKVEMISKCDDELGVEIPDEDAEKLTTYGQLLDYITEKLNNPNPSS